MALEKHDTILEAPLLLAQAPAPEWQMFDGIMAQY
jgi:hypothetical protein